MKKILFPILFTSFMTLSYSQLSTTETTTKIVDSEKSEAEKEALRKQHKKGLSFSKKTNVNTGSLKTSNTTEEKNKQATTVKYYYGTQDSLYKEFNYIKPD